jgi:molybdate transport system permease protein
MTDTLPEARSSPAARRDVLFRGFLAAFLMLFVGMVLTLLAADLMYPKAVDWREAFTTGRPEVWFAVRLSLITSTIALVASFIVGLPSAYALSRFRLPFGTVIDTIIDLPIVIPPPVIGLSLLVAFGPKGFGIDGFLEGKLGFGMMYQAWGIPLAQFLVAAAFCIRALKAAFDSINPRLEHVARSLGCSSWQAFWRVSLPLARNGLIAGAVMTWARAISEFGPILFFCGATPMKTEVLPISMFLNYSSGNIERAVVLALLMVAIAVITLVTFKKLGGKGYLW